MKTNPPIYLILFFFLLGISIQSCSSDDDAIPCYSIRDIGTDYVEYDCTNGEAIEVFVVVETIPSFGSNESDLRDYLTPKIEIEKIDEISNGSIYLRALIFKNGDTCLNRVTGIDVPTASLSGFDKLINGMPKWNPGEHRNEPIHAYYPINITVTDGEIEIDI